MPKRNPLSLSEKIEVFYLDGVWNELPDDKKLTVKQRLVEWQRLAEALESNEALAEAKREITALEAQKEALEAQNKALEAEKGTLKTKTEDFKTLYDQATEQISRIKDEEKRAKEQYRAAKIEEVGLSDLAKKVLLAFADNQYLGREMLGKFSQDVGLKEAAAEHFLEILIAARLLETTYDNWENPNGWCLTSAGRAFLVKTGLIQKAGGGVADAAGDGDRCSAIEEKILLRLAHVKHADFGGLDPSDLSNYVKTGVKLVSSCLERLKGLNFIVWVSDPPNVHRVGGGGWARSDEGDEYLAKYGLLN